MNEPEERNQWIRRRFYRGLTLLAAGAVAGFAGVLIETLGVALPVPPRLLTGLGVLLAGIGLGTVIRYGSALLNKNPYRAQTPGSGDETVHVLNVHIIRARAGSRAYVASAGMIAVGLMWESFAATGSLPHLSGDLLWNALACGLLVPLAVYVLSVSADRRRM